MAGFPKSIGGDFSCCNNNKLESLTGCPKSVGKSFICCYNNKLSSFEGISPSIGSGVIYAINNKLTSLKGLPKGIKNLFCSGNPINSIIFQEIFKKRWIKDYNFVVITTILENMVKEDEKNLLMLDIDQNNPNTIKKLAEWIKQNPYSMGILSKAKNELPIVWNNLKSYMDNNILNIATDLGDLGF